MSVARHECPGCRSRQIDNRLFSCGECWWLLSREARNRISATATMGILSRPRRAAIERAKEEWDAIRTNETV